MTTIVDGNANLPPHSSVFVVSIHFLFNEKGYVIFAMCNPLIVLYYDI
jgi:hypothetical protein